VANWKRAAIAVVLETLLSGALGAIRGRVGDHSPWGEAFQLVWFGSLLFIVQWWVGPFRRKGPPHDAVTAIAAGVVVGCLFFAAYLLGAFWGASQCPFRP
jgi:hypothetical protein